jgi:hypothetical protein
MDAVPHAALWWRRSHVFHHRFSHGSNEGQLASAFRTLREMRLHVRLFLFGQLAVSVRTDGH